MRYNFLLPVAVALALCAVASTSPCVKSRAVQNLGCNCQLNEFFRKEYELALEYLNASNHMMSDQVAQHGFGKMFRKFWRDQLESANTMRKYMIKRGAQLAVPSMLVFNDQIAGYDHFQNEEKVIAKFLDLEKGLNQFLHKNLYSCIAGVDSRTELRCQASFGQVYLAKCGDSHLYPNVTLTAVASFSNDPATANFLDDSFVKSKVERIKFLADLRSKLERHYSKPAVHSKMAKHVAATRQLDQLAMFVIDSELQKQF